MDQLDQRVDEIVKLLEQAGREGFAEKALALDLASRFETWEYDMDYLLKEFLRKLWKTKQVKKVSVKDDGEWVHRWVSMRYQPGLSMPGGRTSG